MADLGQAIEIAVKAHAHQSDKQGRPYILHPLRVMLSVEGEEAQIVAVLHDVVEDTSVSLDDLCKGGFSPAIIEAIRCVTHSKDEPYTDYVVRCKQNPLSRQVKLADLRDNSGLDRVLLRPEKMRTDSNRIHRYVLAYKFITDQLSESEYRELTAKFDS